MHSPARCSPLYFSFDAEFLPVMQSLASMRGKTVVVDRIVRQLLNIDLTHL